MSETTHPPGTATAYRTAEPNAPLLLYTGRVRIVHGSEVVEGDGTVGLTWLPSPRLGFSVPSAVHLGHLDDCKLELVDRGWTCDAAVTHRGSGGVKGVVDRGGTGACGSVNGSTNGPVSQLRFHLVNFLEEGGAPLARRDGKGWYSGRGSMTIGPWRLTIDATEPGIQKLLQVAGGFAITHVAACERADSAPFAPSAAEEFTELLDRALSFCAGRWTGCSLVTGHSSTGLAVWEDWRLPWLSPYEQDSSWFPDYHYENAIETFLKGFFAASADSDVRQSLSYCVHWYIEANACKSGLEGALIMVLIALELLAWLELVNRGGMNRQVFERKEASTKIRQYLNAKGIPSSRGATEMPDLEAYVRTEQECTDWLEGVTRIRNRTVHPPKKAFKEYPVDVLEQAWRYSVHLLERSILAEAGYRGYMRDRVQDLWPQVTV